MPLLTPPSPYIAGKAVKGNRGFFGRQDILRDVERLLSRPDDNSIVLYGQRRVGKTSILLQLLRRLPSPPFVPIYFDLQDKARLPIHQVLYELAMTTANEVGLPSPQKADFEENGDAFHRIFLPQLYEALGEERRPVFLLDEFDVLDEDEQNLISSAAAKTFRPYLRQLMTTEERLGFVFVVGRRMDELSVEFLSTFKAALARQVSVLTPDEANALILQAEKADTLRFDETAVTRILDLTRGHPYLTQLTCQILFDHGYDLATDDNIPHVTVDDVEAVIPKVLDAGGNAFQWIWDGLPPAERIIFSAIASQATEGTVFTEDDITAVLQEAGIRILMKELNLAPQTLVNWQMLEQVDGGYRFYVEFMRRWVAANQPLNQVKDELDRINPLADSLYQTAQGFYQQENNQQAIAQLQQALKINPNHLKAHLLLGTILRDENRLREAVTEFEEVYQLDEREGRFELLRTLLQQGEALEKANDDEGALAAYNRVLAISPREQTAQERKAALAEKKGDQALKAGDLATAIEAYRQAGADKKLAEVKSQKLKAELEQASKEAEAYEAQEEWGKAGDVYERLNKLDPDDARWQQAKKRVESEKWLAERYAEGAGYIQQKEWLKAQKPLADVINRRPDYKDAVQLLGTANRRGKGQPDQENLQRRRLYTYGGAALVAVILLVGGILGYSQIQIQNETAKIAATATASEQESAARLTATAIVQATTSQEIGTQLTATAIAQATASEADSATKVAVAVQGTQLAEVRSTQTAEAHATKLIQDQRTATAAAIATKTAQAPTATPTNTRTPRPTPTPTATIDPETVYDNFNNSTFDGTFNTNLWSFKFPEEECDVAQQDGIMIYKNALSENWNSCRLYENSSQVSINALEMFEARMRIDDDFNGVGYVVHGVQYATNAFKGGYWAAFCGLKASDSVRPYATFDIWTTANTGSYESEIYETIPAEYNRWYTLRLMLDSNTMTIKCFADDKLVGSTIPNEENVLRELSFERYLDMGRSPNSFVTSYVDDVRFLP